MKVFDTSNLDEKMMPLLSAQEAAWIYNGLDVCVTAEVYNTLMAQLETEPENVRATYQTALNKMAPILEMGMRGTYIDENARQSTIIDLENDLASLDKKFQRIMREVFNSELNWRSPIQLKNLFYGILGLKEIKKRNSQGVFAATVNREALEYFDVYLYAKPLARFILAMRDIHKQLSFLKTEIDKDQRIRCTYNLAGTNTGRLASSMSEFGTGTNLQNVNRKLRYPFSADAGMYMCNVDLEQADGRNVGALCHNIFYDADAATIARMLERKTWDGPCGPEFASKFLDACEGGDLHTTVCRMTWPELDWPEEPKAWKKFCDGLIAHGQDSYRQLAKKLGHGCLTADHEVLTPSGWVSIAEKPNQIMAWNPVTEKLQWETPSHWEDKPWHGDMYEIKGNQYDMFATSDHRMPVFNRKGKFVEKPAEFISLYPEHDLKCIGKLADDARGTITENQARLVSAAMADAHIYENGSVRWGFSKERKKRRLEALLGDRKYRVTEYPERNETYYHLPASEVDFPLIKEAGPQMLDWGRAALEAWVDELRHWDGTFQPTFTWIYGKDREHMRWMHTICMLVGQSASYCSNGGHDCARVGLNKRRNRRIGSLNISIKPGNGIQVYCPTVPSSGFITRRNNVIMFSLNTNYYGTPRTMGKHAHVPTKLIEDFQNRYFTQFPAIKAWHNWTIGEIATHGTLTTPFGRRRMFFGRGNDASTWRKAIAYSPQSMTGEQIDRGLLQVWRRFPQVQLLNQVHDSILFQLPFREAEHLIPEVLKTMKVEIELRGGRPFSVPLEASGGWNWGYVQFYDKADFAAGRCRETSIGKIKDNQYGLVKWTGKEERERPSPKRRLQDYLKTGQIS